MWAFKRLWDKGLSTRASGDAVLVGAETPLSNFETRMDDACTATARTRRSRWRSSSPTWATGTAPPRVDDHAVDPAVEPRARRRARHRLRGRGGGRASTTCSRGRARRVREGARRRTQVLRTLSGADLVGRRYEPLFPFFADTPTPSTCSPATSSTPRTAPASCTWRPGSARTTSASASERHRARRARSTSTAATRPR
jgi:isoleucyl-tRNA synthetase